MRTEIKIHSSKVLIPYTENTSIDEAWNLWTFAVREKNKERKQLFEYREKLLLDYGNQSTSDDLQELKILLDSVNRFRDIVLSSKTWNRKELVCSDNLGNNLFLENYEVLSYEEREKQVNSLIDTIKTKIERLSQEPKPDRNQKPVKPFINYLQNVDIEKLMLLLHDLLDNAKSKDFARFMIALKELSYIHIPKPRNGLYKSLRIEFKSIGADAAMNSYFYDNQINQIGKTKISLSEIEETKKLIEKRLKG